MSCGPAPWRLWRQSLSQEIATERRERPKINPDPPRARAHETVTESVGRRHSVGRQHVIPVYFFITRLVEGITISSVLLYPD